MLVLDIGGSYIKYGIADENGKLLPGTSGQTPSDANQDYEHFLEILRHVIELNKKKAEFSTASVAIPGPFDYTSGVSYMKHKFPALYQKSIREPFEQAGICVNFLHDSTAFILGEVSSQDGPSPCGIMLGTGLGFAMIRNHRVCVNAEHTPALALWKMPWKDGIVEDFVSQRAIVSQYGKTISVKEIAQAAREGEKKALETFLTVGRELNDVLWTVVPKLGLSNIIFGGQISQSADLFCFDPPVPWRVCSKPEQVALLGAGRYLAQGKEQCVQIMNQITLI